MATEASLGEWVEHAAQCAHHADGDGPQSLGWHELGPGRLELGPGRLELGPGRLELGSGPVEGELRILPGPPHPREGIPRLVEPGLRDAPGGFRPLEGTPRRLELGSGPVEGELRILPGPPHPREGIPRLVEPGLRDAPGGFRPLEGTLRRLERVALVLDPPMILVDLVIVEDVRRHGEQRD